ncbi:MAG: hypothetical protein R3E12_06645 [Candidatus Eisenbacteria bacterium]
MSSNWVAFDARILTYGNLSPKLGERVFIAPGAAVIGDAEIGEESSIWYNAVIRGDIHRIRIGRRDNVQDPAPSRDRRDPSGLDRGPGDDRMARS